MDMPPPGLTTDPTRAVAPACVAGPGRAATRGAAGGGQARAAIQGRTPAARFSGRPRPARSRDALPAEAQQQVVLPRAHALLRDPRGSLRPGPEVQLGQNVLHMGDRKSTRLNSSHVEISYAVFCLKKKKTKNKQITSRHNQTNAIAARS